MGRPLAAVRLLGTTPRRCLHSSASRRVQRLLWAGSVLDRTTSSLQEVPKDWLLSLGMQADVEQGISFNHLAASHSHSLLTYTTLPPSLPVSANGGADEDVDRPWVGPSGLQKVIAIGRNTYGELGLGYSSQESTWGMVTSGFEGKGGIITVKCGLGSSWMATADGSSRNAKSLLYTFGNHTSGQLGLGGVAQPYALSEGGEPQLQLYSSPRLVPTTEDRVEQIAVGLDHAVVLKSKHDGSQAVFTCGINTDGQVGDPRERICSPTLVHLDSSSFEPPLPRSCDDPIAGVAAGGDSSLLWTASGRVWSWGNSEYGQCLVGGKAIDRIERATEASADVGQSVDGKIVDVQFCGCSVVVLDDLGNVYTAGFGGLGQGKERLESHRLRKVLTNATSISTGLEQASAVVRDVETQSEHLVVWGLDSAAGRLGIGGRKPWPSYMVASRFTAEEAEYRVWHPCPVSGWKNHWAGGGERGAGIKAVAHGRDVMWVLVEDGTEEIGRWQAK